MTQNEEILEILKVRPINSFERFNGGLYAGQLPRCINDLENKEPWKLKGKIDRHREKNGSVTYSLKDYEDIKPYINYVTPSRLDIDKSNVRTVQKQNDSFHYHFNSNAGYQVAGLASSCETCNPQPRQESWL